MVHQKNNATLYNRYPNIFKEVSSILINPKSVLSFGCSTGEEMRTFKDIYFKSSDIYGVDISDNCINICRNEFGTDKVMHYNEFVSDEKKYDVIFAMSVLCKWEDTELTDDSSLIYPFESFNNALNILDSKLNEGGLLVIYNANYSFFESSVYEKYLPLPSYEISESGFVHKFNSKNKKVKFNYSDVIFKKKKQ